MVKQSFKKNLDLIQFAEAIVSTGTYDAHRVLAFVSGVVDLYLEASFEPWKVSYRLRGFHEGFHGFYEPFVKDLVGL